jgi:hypothetical protein
MTRPILLAVASVLLAGVTIGSPARAQQSASSSPSPEVVTEATPGFAPEFSVTIGGGFGTRSLYCDHCTQGSGLSALVKVSRSIGATTALGIEGTAISNHMGPVGSSLLSAMGVITAYVVDRMPLFISGGLGIVAYRQHDGTYAASGTGFGCTGRVGYEARLFKGFSLVPYLGYVSSIGGLRIARTNHAVSTFQVGLGVTVH